MLKTLIETSIFSKLKKFFLGKYYSFEQWLDGKYKNSQTYIIIQGLKNKIKVCFKYSFLGKITEIRSGEEDTTILNESRILTWLINLYKKCKYKIISYLRTSRTNASVDLLKREFLLLPIKRISTVTIVAIFTNIIFSILLKKEIGLFGWFIRISFLLIGFSGLSSNTNWEDLNKTSYFVKRIKNREIQK